MSGTTKDLGGRKRCIEVMQGKDEKEEVGGPQRAKLEVF